MAKAKKRVREPTAPVLEPPGGKLKGTARLLWTLSGWIVALMVGVLDLPAKINSFFAEKEAALSNLSPRFDKKTYSGRWTNDQSLRPFTNMISDGTSSGDHGSLQLDLREDSGKLKGEIVSATILPFTRVFVEGRIAMAGGFDGYVWDIVEGNRRILAYFRLEPDDNDQLHFSADPNFERIVPTEATLWHTSEEMSSGEYNSRYLEMLKDITQKHVEGEKPATTK